MGEFISAGKRVRFTDDEVFRLASDLYQFLDQEYRGTKSIEAARLEIILGHLAAGAPLDSDEWNILTDMENRYGPELAKWRESGRQGQDARVPGGPGRIAEALSVLPASVRAQLRQSAGQSGAEPVNTNLTPMREGTISPPPGLAEATVADLAKNPPVQCDSCKMFVMGRCGGYYNLPVQPGWKCRSWFLDPHWVGDEEAPALSILLESSPLPKAIWELDRMREASGPAEASYHPTICVDFDGVIHRGPYQPGPVTGVQMPGTSQGLGDLSQHYRVVVLTARQDLAAVRAWLQDQGLLRYVDGVTNTKPPAIAYIDDRAIHFTDWPAALGAVSA